MTALDTAESVTDEPMAEPAMLASLLDAIEAALNRGETGNALVYLQGAKDLVAHTPPDAALRLCRASDRLEEIDALVNVCITVLRSGCDVGDDLAVVLDGAYEKITKARSDVDATLKALEGAAHE